MPDHDAGASTKAIVFAHLTESAKYGGSIGALGPRYCPSIEERIVRFRDAERHQVFLEQEGHDTHELYVNGLSTSLPTRVQVELMRTIPGLEHCEMTRPGYVIEYDFYPPSQLHPTLAMRAIASLWFAGQINGTTGYEEAGALVDDPVTRGGDEQCQVFTSRSEFRLTAWQDNAHRRLAPIGGALGMHDADERRAIQQRRAADDRAMLLARDSAARLEQVDTYLDACGHTPVAHGVNAIDLAGRQNVTLGSLVFATGVGGDLPREVVTSVELEIKCAGYLRKERDTADRVQRMGAFVLPANAPYHSMRTLSVEARQKIAVRQHRSLAQASSIPGITPADLQNLILEIERQRSVDAG